MNSDHLIHMANQIAANLAAPHLGEKGEAAAIEQTAQHITLYWDPRMKAAILAAPRDTLLPIARAAIDQLAV